MAGSESGVRQLTGGEAEALAGAGLRGGRGENIPRPPESDEGGVTAEGLQMRAFRQLALANLRELVRDRMTLIFTTLFPLAFLVMFAVIPSNAPVGRVNVAVVEESAPVAGRAISAGLANPPKQYRVLTEPSIAAGQAALATKSADVLVVAAAGSISVTGRSDQQTAVFLVREALLQATRAPGSTPVDLVGSSGTSVFDGRAFGIPAVLILGFSSLALLGTASPIITLRQRGTLRLIGLTPCRRLTFVLAQVPARLGIGLFDLATACVIGTVWGVLHVPNPLALAGVVILGLLLLFACGYFAGGLIRSPELGNGLLAGLMPLVLIASGVLLPLQLMPHALTVVAEFSPLGHFGSLLRHLLTGAAYTYPPLESVLVMAGFTVAVTVLTTFTFRWDDAR